MISPYAKQGYVDQQRRYEFSSVLRFIEDNWWLRPFLTRPRPDRDGICRNALRLHADRRGRPTRCRCAPIATGRSGTPPPAAGTGMGRALHRTRRALLLVVGRRADRRGRVHRPVDASEASTSPAGHLRRRRPRSSDPATVGRRRRRSSRPTADQARGLPDQGEPNLRQPLRDVPRRRRRAASGMDHGVRAPARHAARTGGCPATSRTATQCALRGVGRAALMDGFNQGPSRRTVAYTQLHRDQLPNYWHWASAQRAVRQLLRARAGAVVPEPPVLDRRPVRAARTTTRAAPDFLARTRSAATRRRSRWSRSTTPRATS